MTPVTGGREPLFTSQPASPETPTPAQALAGAPASTGAREKPTRPGRQQAKAARSAARHTAASESAQTGAQAFKSGLDHVLARLKNLERLDAARAEKWRRDLGAQLHDIARQIPGAKGGSR